jgi:23S rRNA (cytosine1962-C5)-methyltransferase
LLDRALACRSHLVNGLHDTAFRLFNGFTEGCGDIVIDLYGSTAVLNNYADPPMGGEPAVRAALEFLQVRLPWVRAAVLKKRNSQSLEERCGTVLFGQELTHRIQENGVWYALNLTMSRDASFHLDTRNLRRWSFEHLRDKTVLNLFAHTGSLGVAALAGGASRVVQLDRNKRFLDLARASYRLNRFAIRSEDILEADFFRQSARLRRKDQRFDCVIIDPPYFASAPTGIVNQVSEGARLLNKVRPLVEGGGHLVAVNNAVFLSGAAYMQTLEAACADGYLKLAEMIPVPEDFTGYPETRTGEAITDPAPFNHSTKIAILEVRRKAV